MGFLMNLNWWQWVLLFLAINFLIIVYNYFSKFWMNYGYNKTLKALDAKALKFKIDIVENKYLSLDPEESINELIEEIRDMEDQLDLVPHDFSSYKETYDETMKKVKDRGYI